MMKKIKKPLLWFGLMSKRLYKKATFLVILILIPLVAFGYSMIDTEDSGIVTVYLAKEQADDAYADEIMADLQKDGQLIRFVVADSSTQAENAVRAGKADAAWIFKANTRDNVIRFANDPKKENALVHILAREDNVALMLAREKLAGKLYECYAPTLYLTHVRLHVPEMAEMSDDEVLEYYYKTDLGNGELFEFVQEDISGIKEQSQDVHYLMTPIRGLLGVIVLLCGLATAMYYMVDSKKGTFAWMPETRRPLAELGCQAVSVLNVSVVALLSLTLIGTATVWWRELLVTLLYVLAVSMFCMVLRRLCGSLSLLGTILPLMIVVTLLVCPVFFDLSQLRALQYVFPPSYYINAVYNDMWLLMMPVYIVVCGGVYLLLGRVFKRI